MSGSQGFRNIAGNPFVYQEDTRSAAVGLDAASATWKVSVLNAVGALPTTAAQITIDPALAGNITLTPNGSVQISTLTAGTLRSSGTGVISSLADGSNGQILIGKTGDVPLWANITSTGGTVAITNAANTINLEASSSYPGGVATWTEINVMSPPPFTPNNGYIMNRIADILGYLPITAAQGTVIRIVGKGVGVTYIYTNAGQTIYFGGNATTAGGYILSTAQFDCVELVCITADTEFVVASSIGNWTIV